MVLRQGFSATALTTGRELLNIFKAVFTDFGIGLAVFTVYSKFANRYRARVRSFPCFEYAFQPTYEYNMLFVVGKFHGRMRFGNIKVSLI